MTSTIDRSLFDQVMLPNYAPQAIIPVRGKGSRVWDQADKEYIDFAGGIAVNSLGHCHPKLVAALRTQSEQLWHLSNVFTNEPALQLAQYLVTHTFADKVFFCSSGTEANEAAFKLARKYSFDHFGAEKHEIISFKKAFHGRSLFTVSVGGQAKYREGFEPTPQGITHLPYNDLEALKATISNNTCAVVLETIQGEGGVIPAHADFLSGVRQLCDQYNALLIFDEVQTGAGRTGYLYDYMRHDILPDILTSAKGLGGGFPVGAMLTTDKVAPSLGFGTHGSTYGGNLLACAVVLEVLYLINNSDLLEGVKHKHRLMLDHLEEIQSRHQLFNDIRGEGLLIGAELVPEYHGKAKQFLTAAAEQGLMMLIAGPNVLRFTPSLIIPDEDINIGMARLDEAIANVMA